MNDPIRASGGLVFRETDDGVEILLVHRPRYDDWSLPKGKNDDGETSQDAARREVHEETGVTGRIVSHLGDVEYVTPQDNDKVVTYYAMRRVADGGFTPNEEVDEIRWLSPKAAAKRLTYDFDRKLVRRADFEALTRSSLMLLVRHAAAGDRAQWSGPDHLRPLSGKGLRQATALVDLLSAFGVDRILSSAYIRCEQTVEPLAHRLGIEVEFADELLEGSGARAVELMQSLAGSNVVLCSHGDVIPACLEKLAGMGARIESNGRLECKKASVWALNIDGGRFDEAHYLPPPPV